MVEENQNLSIKIISYDNEAPEMFKKIRYFLFNVIPYPIEVEHVGSTAVVGLGGKEVIDILIITKQEYMRKVVESLESCGYKFNPEPGFGTFPERFFISGPFMYNERELHVHFHITFLGSKEHKDKLLFRDYLRLHPDEAKNYYELKKQWSREAGSDRAKYTALKSQYINEILEKSRKKF